MGTHENPCPVCGNISKLNLGSSEQGHVNQIKTFECRVCGKYKIADLFLESKLNTAENKYILSAIIRESNELNMPELELKSNNIDNYLSESLLPSSLSEKFNKILMYIYQHTKVYGRQININTVFDYPIAFAVDDVEFFEMLNALSERELISLSSDCIIIDLERKYSKEERGSHTVTLTTEGWEYVDKLKALNPIQGDQCFVAMWFDKKMDDIWEKGIQPGIIEAGYKPKRIDKVEHNDQITDRIISEIRQSRIMVADFTGQRPGVYYEAGFARALNKTVISCCQEDDLINLHFDTRQFSHIVWKDAVDLREKVRDRILATAPLK